MSHYSHLQQIEFMAQELKISFDEEILTVLMCFHGSDFAPDFQVILTSVKLRTREKVREKKTGRGQ